MINNLIAIAKEAGEIIREGFGKNFTIEIKSNESNLVTEIDKKSENHILNFIHKKYPTHNILAEESGEYSSNSEYLWVIDPLDGTTNFAHHLPIFAVSIGLQKNGKTIAGVVYDVMMNQLYSAEPGSGAFCNGVKIKVSKGDSIRKAFLVTGFPYNIYENPNKSLEIFSEMIISTRAVRRLGSAAIDLCYVALGVFDGFWEELLNPWDISAGMLIVEEAGGMITDFNGSPIDIYSKQILASNKLIHKEMIRIINDTINKPKAY
jgi:myo-inositol-1(or 4)-monophosphatase